MRKMKVNEAHCMGAACHMTKEPGLNYLLDFSFLSIPMPPFPSFWPHFPPSSLSSSLPIFPCSRTTTVAPSLNFSCHCWVAGSRLLRNAPLSPLTALSSTETPLYVLPLFLLLCASLSLSFSLSSPRPLLHVTRLLSATLWPHPFCVICHCMGSGLRVKLLSLVDKWLT